MHPLQHLRDRVGFTPGEVKAVLLLSFSLVVGHGIRALDLIPAPLTNHDQTTFDYRSLDSIFIARSDQSRPRVPGSTGKQTDATALQQPVDINTADANALAALPGIGPVYARRIVAYRDAHGPFRSVDELLAVSGIGTKRLASLRKLVVIR